jgi:AraC-like DNA-binding protein
MGSPVERYMRRQGLPALCDDPNALVPLARAWSFFDAVARREDEALGWRVGAYVGDHGLNASLLRQLESAPTLLQALRRLIRMASAEASHIQLGIRQRPNDVILYTRYAVMTAHPGYVVSQAYQLGVLVDLIRHFLGRCWVPRELGVSGLSVPRAACERFAENRILTQQPMAYVAVPRDALHRASPRHCAGQREANPPVLTENFGFLDTLRALLAAYLSEGYPSARLAASLVNMSERTLARRLADCGATYGELVDEVRFEAASRHLRDPDLPIGDVARYVGFADQSHFSRMFRRIAGLSPREFRKAQRA